MIYFTSDLHFCHSRSFIYEPRGFSSVYEMNNTIVKNFNEVISWTDDLYILGDLMLNDNVEGIKLIQRLPGNLHIILGNHDSKARIELYKQDPRIEIIGYASMLDYGGLHFYLSHYPTATTNFDIEKPLKARILALGGHTHSKNLFEPCGSYNVALDAHNNMPISIDDIIKDFKEAKSY